MNNSLLEQFIIESKEYLQKIGEILIKLEEEGSSKELLNELFRLVHTLKGNSGLFDFPAMTKLLHASEDLMNRLRDGSLEYTSEIADILLEAMDTISQMIDEIEASGELQPSTNETAFEKASFIRNFLSEGKDSLKKVKKRVEKIEDQPTEVKSYDYLVIPEDTRMLMVRALFEGKPVRILQFSPEEECFYKGDDPFLLVRNTPNILWGRYYLRERIEDIETLDIYKCITNFDVVAIAEDSVLKEHFQYVLDQIEIIIPSISQLIIPKGDRNGGPVYEDFVEEFTEMLKKGDKGILKNSLRALKELTAPNLYVSSCLRWIELLIDYLPDSMVYIEGLLRSIKTFEPPRFGEVQKTYEIKPEVTEKSMTIPKEVLRVFEEQKKVLEKISSVSQELKEGILKSVFLSLENALTASKNSELLERLKQKNTIEDIRSFIEECLSLKVEEYRKPEKVEKVEKAKKVECVEKEEKVSEVAEKPSTTKVLKVDETKIDRLMNLIGELVVTKNSLLYLSRKVDTEYELVTFSKEMKQYYSVINKIAEEMQDAIMQVRMIPVSTVFQRFPRLVRYISKKLGKKVKLIIEGEETEADKNVVEALADPFIHLVRNSLDHGIEPPEERIAKGKPEIGTIILRAKQEADRVVIQVEDDGRGIDPQKVKQKAYEKGLISEEELEKLKDEEALNLIFLPGFSTKEVSSELSGRGVGMDVVRSMVDRYNGTVSVTSVKDKGTTITLSLPLSMAVSHVMLVEAANQKYGIPMDTIIETVRIKKEEIHVFKGVQTTSLRGKVIPILFLNDLLELGVPPVTTEDGEYAVLVLNIKNEMAGIVVDKFLGTADIILKPLPGFMADITLFSGTAIMGDGSVLLVINPKELIEWR
ncbi:chemotaxis protein CheA [Thermodesulfobacterium hveragerdense]|uniref:chemotaxis protein CheA n=1 Tax=Thermodesulfobacterium hveragerdense TaxID=53424 RepID=UPI000412915E|nr:chemotaxis protein CheA [Thermodesulfobacterium hveragerdense]